MEQRVKQVMASVFDVNIDQIDENASMDVIENWDSLRHMNLIVALEEEFKISFTETQMVEMITYPLVLEVLRECGVF